MLITSRDRLAGLVARHGAYRIDLGRFSRAEATELMRALIGAWVDTELPAVEALADPRTALRAVFSWSYRHLPDDAARLFRLLGMHPGRSVDAADVAALAGSTRPSGCRTCWRAPISSNASSPAGS